MIVLLHRRERMRLKSVYERWQLYGHHQRIQVLVFCGLHRHSVPARSLHLCIYTGTPSLFLSRGCHNNIEVNWGSARRQWVSVKSIYNLQCESKK